MAKPRKKSHREKPEFEQKLLDLRRVTRVVKGGRRFRFRATVVIGDRRGKVGVGVSKGVDVTDAIAKAYAGAKKTLIQVPIFNGTIPHDIQVKLGSAKVLLKPASKGRGLIAGGAVRVVVDFAGINDITAKSLGTSNKLNVARATLLALSRLQLIERKKSEKKSSSVGAEQEVKEISKKKVLKEKKIVKETQNVRVLPKKVLKEKTTKAKKS
ncbi:MAG: 30S ribosomal protein S5 [Candidatus Moranbacteria bacterium]|nr:30S ribosomal protein S5 [Candidatus Moranbacteria bacterium]